MNHLKSFFLRRNWNITTQIQFHYHFNDACFSISIAEKLVANWSFLSKLRICAFGFKHLSHTTHISMSIYLSIYSQTVFRDICAWLGQIYWFYRLFANRIVGQCMNEQRKSVQTTRAIIRHGMNVWNSNRATLYSPICCEFHKFMNIFLLSE